MGNGGWGEDVILVVGDEVLGGGSVGAEFTEAAVANIMTTEWVRGKRVRVEVMTEENEARFGGNKAMFEQRVVALIREEKDKGNRVTRLILHVGKQNVGGGKRDIVEGKRAAEHVMMGMERIDTELIKLKLPWEIEKIWSAILPQPGPQDRFIRRNLVEVNERVGRSGWVEGGVWKVWENSGIWARKSVWSEWFEKGVRESSVLTERGVDEMVKGWNEDLKKWR